jgi:F-type H+-transporting ATPase subunit b
MTWFVTPAFAEDAAPAAAPATTEVQPAAAPPAATHSEVGQEEGHHGAFPPFDTNTFPSQILWFVICFGVLYLLSKRLILPRVGDIVEARAAKIAGDIGEAQRLRSESDTALAAYEKALAEARSSAHRIAQTATDEAKDAADKRRVSVEAELSAKLAEAEKRIGDVKSRALADVGAIAQEAATAVVSTLIGQEPTPDEAASAVAAVTAKQGA